MRKPPRPRRPRHPSCRRAKRRRCVRGGGRGEAGKAELEGGARTGALPDRIAALEDDRRRPGPPQRPVHLPQGCTPGDPWPSTARLQALEGEIEAAMLRWEDRVPPGKK